MEGEEVRNWRGRKWGKKRWEWDAVGMRRKRKERKGTPGSCLHPLPT